MKKEELIVELKKAVPEGVEVDFSKWDIDSVNTFANTDTNNVVASKKEEFMAAGQANFLKENGFEDIDKFKGSIEQYKKDETKIGKDLTKANQDLGDITAKYNKLNDTVTGERQSAILTGDGEGQFKVKKDFGKFVRTEVLGLMAKAKADGKEITFEDGAKTYLETNKQYIDPYATGRRNFGNNKRVTDEDAYLAEKYKNNPHYKGKKK